MWTSRDDGLEAAIDWQTEGTTVICVWLDVTDES